MPQAESDSRVRLAKSNGSCRDVDAVGGEIDIGRERVADHLGLLVDLLRHEVAVVALVDEERGGERARDRPLDRLAAAVADGDAAARQHRPVAVLEIGDGVGEGRERDGVGADEHLAVAEADGERAALARHDHQSRCSRRKIMASANAPSRRFSAL